MKSRLLIGAAALLVVQGALAIKKASDDDIKAIRAQIKTAALMDEAIGKANARLQKAKDDELSGYEITRAEWARDREIDKQRAARTKAVHMTLNAYDLWGAKRSGTSVAPQTKGRTIAWMPVAREPESRQVQDRDGVPRDLPQPKKKYTGITYQDGVTYLPKEAFLRGPGYLATTLLHERIHFEQNITPGKGDVQSAAEADVEAFGEEAKKENMDLLLDPKMKEYSVIVEHIATGLAENEAAVKQAKESRKTLMGKLKHLIGPPGPPDWQDRRLHSPDELELIRKESDSLEAIVAAELENARREREKQQSNLDGYRRRQSLEYISHAAKLSCRRGRTDSEVLDFPKVSDQRFYCLSDPGWSSDDDCPARIYSMLLGQLCRSGDFNPEPINEMIGMVYGPKVGPAPDFPGTERSPLPGATEASGLGRREQEEAAAGRREYVFQQVTLSLNWLRGKAAKACADPASLADDDIPTFRTSYVWLRDEGQQFKVPTPESAADGLAGCPKELLLWIIHQERQGFAVSGGTSRQKAAEIAASHSPAPPSDSGDDGDRGSGRGGNRVGDGNGPARGQAGKIGGSGTWPR